MGRLLGYLNKEEDDLVILTATSGDTGSAVANGFYDIHGIKVVVLYPKDKVSERQESQMTTLGKNIFPVRVNGTFDDCQYMVKKIFNDVNFRKDKRITSANSINILRWIPQSFYYFYGYCQWKRETGLDNPIVAVPSGNYGNLSAGILAKKMGLPLKGFIAASNENDIIPDYLKTGCFFPKPSVYTISSAMDVGNPSNYERILDLYGNNFDAIIEEVKGYSCKETDIKKAMKDIHERYSYISDPHSAIGYLAARFYDIYGFWLSTAHSAKFNDVIKSILGLEPMAPLGIIEAEKKDKNFLEMEIDLDKLKSYIRKL